LFPTTWPEDPTLGKKKKKGGNEEDIMDGEELLDFENQDDDTSDDGSCANDRDTVRTADVEGLLSRMLDPTMVREAEEEAEGKMESATFNEALVGITFNTTVRTELRQMAASVLRRSLPASWGCLSSSTKRSITKSLTTSVVGEGLPLSLRKQIAVILGAVAPLSDSYSELHSVIRGVMASCTEENDPLKREVSGESVLLLPLLLLWTTASRRNRCMNR